MSSPVVHPELSVIVPTLNEQGTLPDLLENLGQQRGISFEVIVVDGGSRDGTRALVASAANAYPLTLVDSPAGRGTQLNAGARRARGEWLLFLHADSRFSDSTALVRGARSLAAESEHPGGTVIAGRYAVRFTATGGKHPGAYAFYESKARRNRPGCIHGDQGFLLQRHVFFRLGPFDTDLPFLEDERFAERVFRQGRWLLLPAEIATSARRFVAEGLFRRQWLNALILNALAIGWFDFLRAAPGLYRTQDQVGRIDLGALVRVVRRLMRDRGWRERWRFCYDSAEFILDNAWQLLLALDVRRGLRRDRDYRGEKTPCLDRWERPLNRMLRRLPGRFVLAAGLGFAGFLLLLFGRRPARE
jgi:rSAM/selenodomain-associated transferase 2